MDPYYEQRLRDEVIYLHSLWHQGPPRPTATAAAAASPPQLRPVKPTKFKKQKKRKAKIGEKSTNTAPETHSSPGAEWPCPASPLPSSPTGWHRWPTPEPKPQSQPNLLSIDDQSKLDSKNAHQTALRVVREFLVKNNADDSDDMDSSSDEGDELMGEDYEYRFFFKVFKDDSVLREFYEKNFARGEFSCLVCGSISGKKRLKKFKGCLPLVQHSIAIAKTKRRRAHRAFGQAICKVLGWDIDNLNAVVSMLTDPMGDALGAGSSDNKESSMTLLSNVVSVNSGDLEGKNVEAVPESVDVRCEIPVNGDDGNVVTAARDGAGTSDNMGSSLTLVSNVVSLNSGDIEEKNEEAVPESVDIRCGGISVIGDEANVVTAARDGARSGDNMESSITLVSNVVSVNNGNFEDKNGEYVPERVDIRCEGNVVTAARDGPGSGDNMESSITLVSNVVSVNNGDSEDNNEEDMPESVDIRCGISINGCEGNVVTVARDGAGSGDNMESSITLVSNVVSVNNGDLEDKNEEYVPESLDIRCGISVNGDDRNVVTAARDGAGSSDNMESSITLVSNIFSVKNDDLEGKNEEPVSESEDIQCRIPLNGDEGDVNSLACPDADKNLENFGMENHHNMEETSSKGLIVVPQDNYVRDEVQDLHMG